MGEEGGREGGVDWLISRGGGVRGVREGRAWIESSGGGGWERGGDVCTSQWEFGREVPRAF